MAPAALALNFHRDGEATRLQVLRQEPPWRAVRAFRNESGEALIHLHNVSGGILSGDDLHFEATLQPQAQAQITSTGATRIYRHRLERTSARQATCLYVGQDALLEYLPDPIIPFAGSRFQQSLEIHLAEGAGLICWETISAGRVESGERFAFETFSANTAIYAPSGPLVLERYSLNQSQDLSSPARFGRFLYSAAMFICRIDDGFAGWRALEEQLNAIGESISCDEARWGASTLTAHGVVVRGLTRRAQQASEGLRLLWQTAKQEIWDRPAIPPRKVY